MPCYDPTPDYVYDGFLKAKLDLVTRLLCSVMTHASNRDYLLGNIQGLSRWWYKHIEDDNQRKQIEEREEKRKQAKRKALEKLTLAEREILGLK